MIFSSVIIEWVNFDRLRWIIWQWRNKKTIVWGSIQFKVLIYCWQSVPHFTILAVILIFILFVFMNLWLNHGQFVWEYILSMILFHFIFQVVDFFLQFVQCVSVWLCRLLCMSSCHCECNLYADIFIGRLYLLQSLNTISYLFLVEPFSRKIQFDLFRLYLLLQGCDVLCMSSIYRIQIDWTANTSNVLVSNWIFFWKFLSPRFSG